MSNSNTPNVLKYTDVLKDLNARGAQIKAAAAKKADSVPSVPETDPEDKGTVSIPKDPNADNATQNLPASGKNADGTPVYSAPPAKVIDQPEKAAAALSTKAAKLLATVQGLKGVTKKADSTAAQISTPGSLPNDAGNDNKSKQPLATPKPAPAAGTADPAVKDAGKDGPKDKGETAAPMPAGDSKGELPADGKNTNDTTKEAAGAEPDLSAIDHTFFSKLAWVTLQFEDGRAMMESCLKKAHGAEQAQNLIKTALFMEQRMQELAEMEDAGASSAEVFWKNASDADRQGLIKLASTHETALLSFSTDIEREAYLEGAKIAADMADAGMAGEQPPPGVPGMGGEGDPAAPAGAEGGEVSDEDIIQALQMLVQQGKITEQDAEAILQQLLGGADGAGAGGGADPGAAGAPPGAGGPPPDAGGAPAGAGGPPPGGAGAGGPPPEEDKEAAAHLRTVGQAVDAVFASLSAKA